TTKLYKVWSIKRRAAFHVPSNCIDFNENEFPGSEIVTSATRVHNESEGAETQSRAQIRPSNGHLPVPVGEQMPVTSVTENPTPSQLKRAQSSVGQSKDLCDAQAGNEEDNGLSSSQIEASSQRQIDEDSPSESQVIGTDASEALPGTLSSKYLQRQRRAGRGVFYHPPQSSRSGRTIKTSQIVKNVAEE